MAKLYWKVKTNGVWGWYNADNYTGIHEQCECKICLRLQKEEE